MPWEMVFSGKNFFFRHDRVFWRQWLRKLAVWKVNCSPPVFSFLLSLAERLLLIAWLTISNNSWYTTTVSFREEYERSKMITRGQIEQSFECCFAISYSKGFNESNVWTPPFSGKPCYEKHFSLILYTSGEFFAKSLKITHLNLLLITEKAFQLMWLVEPGLWFSFTIHWIILCTQV